MPYTVRLLGMLHSSSSTSGIGLRGIPVDEGEDLVHAGQVNRDQGQTLKPTSHTGMYSNDLGAGVE